MQLTELHQGDRAKIVSVDATKTLKQRLASLGVVRGETLVLRGCSLAKQTMEIEIDATLVALRSKEAQTITIAPLP